MEISPAVYKMFNFKKKKQTTPREVLKKLEAMDREIKGLSKELEFMKEKSMFFLQKVEMVRYNPFSNTGGDQSFSAVLLDENNTGIIITSLYAREGNRVYGKRVKGGKPEQSLSQEEEKILNKAVSHEKN